MINSIVDIFREQARCHKSIQSFYYNRNFELGSGNEAHPMLWLEDPITGRNQSNLFVNSVNFSVLFIPDNNNDELKLQNLAFSVGLNIIERIKHQQSDKLTILPDWTYITLRNYYDNNACGCRFSVNFNQLNMQNLCLIDEQFDNNLAFHKTDSVNSFNTKHEEIFSDKLPVFDLKTSK